VVREEGKEEKEKGCTPREILRGAGLQSQKKKRRRAYPHQREKEGKKGGGIALRSRAIRKILIEGGKEPEGKALSRRPEKREREPCQPRSKKKKKGGKKSKNPTIWSWGKKPTRPRPRSFSCMREKEGSLIHGNKKEREEKKPSIPTTAAAAFPSEEGGGGGKKKKGRLSYHKGRRKGNALPSEPAAKSGFVPSLRIGK